MNADGLKDLFQPFAAVAVRRMCGGHGVYADGLCFAIEAKGEVFLKVDGETKAAFAAAGSSPFLYDARGRSMTMAYWRLPDAAYDDAEALRRWSALGLDAAQRAATVKGKERSRKAVR